MVPNLHITQYIAFSWISSTLVQDFLFVCPLSFISNLNYTSNRIELSYNETRFQPIKHPTLFKFLHNTSVKRLRSVPQFELFMQCDSFHCQINIYHSEVFVTPAQSSAKLLGRREIKKCLRVYWLHKCEQDCTETFLIQLFWTVFGYFGRIIPRRNKDLPKWHCYFKAPCQRQQKSMQLQRYFCDSKRRRM